MVEAKCNLFGLETLDGEPSKHLPNGVPAEEIEKWHGFKILLTNLFMSMCGPGILMPALLLLRSMKRLFPHHYS